MNPQGLCLSLKDQGAASALTANEKVTPAGRVAGHIPVI